VTTRVDDTMTVAKLVLTLAEHDVLLVRVGRRRPREDGGVGHPWLAVLEARWDGAERPLRFEGGGYSLADAVDDALEAVRTHRQSVAQ